MSPRRKRLDGAEAESKKKEDTQEIVAAYEFVRSLPGLSQAAYARFCNIRDRVYQIRKLLSLHDLDTARLYKRFFDEPDGIGNRVIANALGLVSRHYGLVRGAKIDRLDPRLLEFRAVVVWSSPLNLEVFDHPGGPRPNDVEAMLAPLMTHPAPDWSSSDEVVSWVKGVISGTLEEPRQESVSSAKPDVPARGKIALRIPNEDEFKRWAGQS